MLSHFFNEKEGLKKDISGPSEKNVDCSSPHGSLKYGTQTLLRTAIGKPHHPHLLLNKHTSKYTKIHPLITSKTLNINISGLHGFRQRLLVTGISGGTSQLISSTRRQGSLSHCNPSWSKWASWCGERKMDLFRCALGKVLDYLSYLFDSGFEYRKNFCCHKSTISTYREYVDNKPVGQHPHACALLKGVFNQRPTHNLDMFLDSNCFRFCKMSMVRA